MRVLQLGKFYDPVVGGMESALREMCETMREQGEGRVVVANTRMRTEHEMREVAVTRVASLGKLWSCSMAPAYPLWARKFEADVMHVHVPNPLAELSAMMAAREMPVVAHFHSDVVRQKNLLKIYRPFLEAFYRRVNAIVVPTPTHIEISEFVRRHREKCHVVPFGIPLQRFELGESGRRRVEELRDGRPMVLAVGRLVGYKGVGNLIRAGAGAAEKRAARLVIIGTGPLEKTLRDEAQRAGIAERVEFAGQVSDAELVAYYHAAELFVLPSITNAEMFGIVQLEARACGKAVISTNLPTGVPWVNQHGKTGMVVAPGDVGVLAEAIRYLLENGARRREMGAAGRKRVEKHFTSERMAAGLMEVYRAVVGERAGEEIWQGVPAKRPRSEEALAAGEKYASG